MTNYFENVHFLILRLRDRFRMKRFRVMEFCWDQNRLMPSTISVREDGDFWRIFVADCPMLLRYTSAHGAR